jgi:hypothetical protein
MADRRRARVSIKLTDAPGGARLIESLAAAAQNLSLLYANTPDDRARAHLEGFCADLEAILVESLGAENAAVVARAFVSAVMGRKHELELAAGANAPTVSR